LIIIIANKNSFAKVGQERFLLGFYRLSNFRIWIKHLRGILAPLKTKSWAHLEAFMACWLLLDYGSTKILNTWSDNSEIDSRACFVIFIRCFEEIEKLYNKWTLGTLSWQVEIVYHWEFRTKHLWAKV